MKHNTPPFTIEERSGSRSPSLEDAQRAALPGLAADLADTLRVLLAAGELVQEKGRVIPNPRKDPCPDARLYTSP